MLLRETSTQELFGILHLRRLHPDKQPNSGPKFLYEATMYNPGREGGFFTKQVLLDPATLAAGVIGDFT